MDNSNKPDNQKPSLSWSQPAANNTPKQPAPVTAPVKLSATPVVVSSDKSNIGAYVGIFVGGLIVGALIGWGISASHNNDGAMTAATSTTSTTSSTTAMTGTATTSMDLSGSTMSSNGAVMVASPQTAGFAVTLSHLSIAQPTWLVVYENHNGMPGNILGAGLFFAGVTNGTVQLLRATLPGNSYFVGESIDDGDKMFSMTSDKAVLDTSGNTLLTAFTAQ